MSDEQPRDSLLAGIKVLDFTHVLAGPTCTRILADLGAEVVKIESAPNGDVARSMFHVKENLSAMFLYTCAGKKSLCVDLKKPEGLQIAKDLVATFDVVVENFAPGVMKKLGLEYAALKAINPKIIMASISGFGQTGPWADRTSFDIIGQAMSGVMHMTGEPDGPPQYVGNGIGDPNAGVHTALAICASLFYRDRTGKGQYIDIAQVDSLLYLDLCNLPYYALSHGAFNPKRFGAYHYAVAPLGVFKGNDGYVVLQAIEHQWPQFAKAIGREDLLTNAKFATNAKRLENKVELAKIIEDWLQSFPNNEAALNALAEQRVPCAPILDLGGALSHPQTLARGMVTQIEHPVYGTMPIVNTPFAMSEAPRHIQGPAPFLGQHNAEVLKRYLNYDEGHITQLTQSAVLFEEERVKELRQRGVI
ncbi:MAG: CoA transferase [Deltaproteobacteria bacterium]|nr:CoA transferase [Deltaproteobacteria bacterium]